MLKEKNAPNIEIDKDQLDKFCSYVVKFQDVQITEHHCPTQVIATLSLNNAATSNDVSTASEPSETKPDTWSEYTVTVSVDGDYIITVAIAELLEEAKYAIGGGVGGGVAGAGTGAGLGAGIGALVGVIGGPVGMVAGAHIGAAIGAAAGGATGAGAGVTAGVMKSKQRENISARDIFKHIPNGRIVNENVKNRDEKIVRLVYTGELKWGEEDTGKELRAIQVVSQHESDDPDKDEVKTDKEQKVLDFSTEDEDKDLMTDDPQNATENRGAQDDRDRYDSVPHEERLMDNICNTGQDSEIVKAERKTTKEESQPEEGCTSTPEDNVEAVDP